VIKNFTIEQLQDLRTPFVNEIQELKSRGAPDRGDWYPYDTMSNISHLDHLLPEGFRDLGRLARGRPVADIGAADGDLAFLLDRVGFDVEIIENPSTNANGLTGARKLKQLLGARLSIDEVDLDEQFYLSKEHYGLVFFLGILYHLQNPFLVLKKLSERAEFCLISTRITQLSADRLTRLDSAPVAYLVDPYETNNDPTNYWIFTEMGLRRIFSRTGWEVVSLITLGALVDSDPASAEFDQRAFALLRSRNA
jgi:hypothetical protein